MRGIFKVYNLVLIFFILILLGACSSEEQILANPYQIEITGHDYEWHILYPGKDGQLYTDDDIKSKQNLNLPFNAPVELILKSEDYLYFLELPGFKQIGMAVSDQINYIRFKPNKTGTSDLKGNQMCANAHERLLGELNVYRPFWFSFWQNKI